MKGRALMCIVLGLLAVTPALAPAAERAGETSMGTPEGWSEDINLSNDPVIRDNLPKIAVSGDNIHVVWLHNYQDVYYIKSIDKGITWSNLKVLYHCPVNIVDPYIGVSDNTIHVVWTAPTSVNEVQYCNSTDNGETWSTPKTIFNTPPIDVVGWGIYVNGSNVHVISEDFRDGANGEIYYRRSLDGGITWDNGQGVDEDRRITYDLTVKTGMKINGDNSNISITWQDERDGDWEAYWMISKDNGYTWEDGLGTPHVGRRLTSTTSDVMDCAITVNSSNIHIAWVEMAWPGPEYTMYYRNTTDNGVNWNNPTLLAGPWAGITEVGLDAVGDNVHLAWGDKRVDGEHSEIFYKNSSDGGITWSTDLRLTFNLTRDSFHPKIAVENDIRHIVWYDRWPSNGDREVFYKRYPDFPVPTYTIPLSQGWNLLSTPLIPSDGSINKVLENITGKWDCIQLYNSSDSDHWKTNLTYRPDQLNDLNSLDYRMGFWINIIEPGVFLTLKGQIPDNTVIPLYAGWNLVGYPTLNDTMTVGNALWGTGADRVEVCDALAPYRLKEVGSTYVMKPGEGYWVHVPADSTWVVDW